MYTIAYCTLNFCEAKISAKDENGINQCGLVIKKNYIIRNSAGIYNSGLFQQ